MLLRFLAPLLLIACLGGASPAASPVPPDWNEAMRAQTLTAAEKALTKYTFANEVPALRASIEAHRSTYLAIQDPQAFSEAVTADLYAVTHDKHVRLNYSANSMPMNNDKPTAADMAHFAQLEKFGNFGYNAAMRLQGNVGYLRLGGAPGIPGFWAMPDSKAAIDSAMGLLAHTDALIIDIRHNGGGDPDSLDYLMGYFFEKPTELTSIVMVQGGKTQILKQFSAGKVAATRYLGKPLYVLTDDRTFSCAEQFAYDMKTLHRATLVGHTTGGGANPGAFFGLNDHFAVFVPLGRAENPYTKTNWEGVGVAPNIAIAPEKALLDAYTRALGAERDSFDLAVAERNRALKDPATALAASVPQL